MVVCTPNAFFAASCARDVKQKTDKDTSTLKPVEAADVFGNSHIKRTVLKKPAETHKVMEVYHTSYNTKNHRVLRILNLVLKVTLTCLLK
jgi:hypothetical protein